jgi:AAA15 family ATPase/GTPase
MSKIQKIQVKNFKAVESQETDFRGCSAIITAGNNKGKTSFLKGLIDRLRGERPELVLRNEEKEGYNLIELTSGEKFEWTFVKNEQGVLKEKLVFVSKDNKKTDVTANMKQSIGNKAKLKNK